MIISVNWLKEYTDIDLPIAELATLIGARLVEIEETIDLSEKYKNVVIARVASCEKLEDSDHLNVTKLDDGGVVDGVERDENGYVQVVCGAPNVRAGLLVAWLPPQTTVPETFGTNEPFVLGARKLRGVMSNGMIASPRELALFDDHEGILEIADMDVQPGVSFSKTFALDDTLLDIENKSLTHRPDAFGVIGFAREVAGIQNMPFKTPVWLKNTDPDFAISASATTSPKVSIDDPELSARYQGVVIGNLDGLKKSQLSLQTFLARVGMRPISAIVDVTNYLMLETGQPLHAFDYDKLAAVNNGAIDIHVRSGREGETLALLDGRTITLSSEDIIIANGETAVALAGAMGGADTEIDESTKTIFLESATFNLYNLRATQMRHGIFSEAITRFTKGQPAALTAPVLRRFIELLEGTMTAVQLSEVVEDYPKKRGQEWIELSRSQVNKTLGSDFTAEAIEAALRNVEFIVEGDGEMFRVAAPYWRSDIHISEDIIEEVGRLNGFDSIKPTLPERDFTAVVPSDFDVLRARVRDLLTRAGANELLTYSFVHGDILEKAGQKRDDSYRITNSISPDLQYYRQTLTPSLLQYVYPNIKQGYDAFALFELNKVHPKTHGMTDENVPREADMLGLVVANKNQQEGAPYYQAKRLLDYLAQSLGLELEYASVGPSSNYPVTAPFEYRHSAFVTDKKTNTFLGIVGEYRKSVSRAFKLPASTAGFELGMNELYEAVSKLESNYTPISRFPGTERDICFRVSAEISYAEIVSAVARVLESETVESSIAPVDIYQSEDKTMKNITIRIKLIAHDRTLTGDDAARIVDDVTTNVIKQTNATVV
ncbi:MAG TPA: phenylalanine--tRNA ligase subunit beta [Candidatus Saccharimonadales bacterium]|nr:phenylalanine--tRNA ligase subunit beta [Candidatus Saccharimonadales bacterium]